MSLKPTWSTIVLLAVLCSAGCSSAKSLTENDYVGEYVFKPGEDVPSDFADFVILESDHTALEVRFIKKTGRITTTRKSWRMAHGTEDDIDIGDFSHPVERSGASIRLGISIDRDLYYEKIR